MKWWIVCLLLCSCEADQLSREPDPICDAGSSDADQIDAAEIDAGAGPSWQPIGWQTRELWFADCPSEATVSVPCRYIGQQIFLAEGAVLLGIDEPVMQGSGANLLGPNPTLMGRLCTDLHSHVVQAPVFECVE